MRDIYLLNYNNYYNRIIKKFETLEEYEDYLAADIVRNINFVPNNFVNTEVIINSQLFNLYNMPDYLLVVNNELQEIESRWFILNSVRTSNGQWRFQLRRDVIADNLDNVLTAQSFIYKGFVEDTNPAIFNNENISLNKIKQSETLLKDYTQQPWIVAYISADASTDHPKMSGTITGYYDQEFATLENYPYYNYINKKYTYTKNNFIVTPILDFGSSLQPRFIKFFINDTRTVVETKEGFPGTNIVVKRLYFNDFLNELKTNFSKISYNDFEYPIETVTDIEFTNLQEQDGHIIKANNKLYTVHFKKELKMQYITPGSKTDISMNNVFWNDNTLIEGVRTALTESQKLYPKEITKENQLFYYEYCLELSEEDALQVTFNYDLANKDLSNSDSVYGILCIPYFDNKINNSMYIDKYGKLKIMQALATAQGLVYDIQILPYSPITNLTVDENLDITIPDNIVTIPVYNASSPENVLTYIMVAPRANISFKIYDNPIKLTDIKMQNDTDMWRLTSPNWSGVFEFNASKFFEGNKTVINYWSVDISFKPYSPYIHVAPEFAGLYNKDFSDTRGLICSGSFSVDILTDNWQTYMLNNKNYQLQFDRTISTMEYNRNWELSSNIINSVTNVAGTSAAAGMLGGPIAAGLGGLFSSIDGIYNTVEANAKSQRAIDDAKLQFAWNNENIQAQPYGLSNVGTMNNNNKLFPFVEYYTCTDEEKELYKNKLKYEGMTLNRVGQIKDYIQKDSNYINARLLRLEDINNNSLILNTINDELSQGVYLYAN